ncbi:MAG: PAS domain S-box protein [Ignavibacteria bacterium]|nr:PAS domain S-box protein [Ignavibacteria bacterium]
MEKESFYNSIHYQVDICIFPSPILILDGFNIITFNDELTKILPEGANLSVPKNIQEIGLFRENQLLQKFYSFIENRSEVTDFPLSLWNGATVFVSLRNFQQDGKQLTLVSLFRFALSQTEKFETIFGNINYVKEVLDKFDFWILIRDRNSNLVLCNKSFEKFVGIPQEKLIGKSIDYIFGSTEVARIQKETDKELFEGKKDQIHFHIQVIDSEGKTHFLEVSKFLINFGGESFVFCISLDTSELDYIRQLYEESSTLYRALIENAFDAIYLMKGRRYIYVNPRFCELTGYSYEELTSPNFDFSVFVSDESKKFLEERYRARLEGREIPNQYELEIINKSGRKIYVEVNTVSVGKPGEVVVMGIMRDITQRKLYEKQLKESEERLRELNYAKDKFFNIIAHDLRSPLSGLISLTKMLIENFEVLSPIETKELLVDLLEYADQSYNLLENLLQWAKTQTGSIPFKPENTDLFEVVLSSIVINEPNAKQKNVKIINLVQQGSYSYVDRNMITTVVRNLVSNAVKFSKPGGNITINLQDKDNLYELIVEDNGIGMSKEQIDKLFKLGENITTTGTYGEKGSGLGLLLCKEFVEKNGGKIKVESEIGKGSKFIVILPKFQPSLTI